MDKGQVKTSSTLTLIVQPFPDWCWNISAILHSANQETGKTVISRLNQFVIGSYALSRVYYQPLNLT